MQYVISVVAGRPRPYFACEVAKRSLIKVYEEVDLQVAVYSGPKC